MIKGSMVALVTPMLASAGCSIDWSGLERLVAWHIQEGTDALVVCGTTGESQTLTAQERLDLLGRVVDQVAKRMPVIMGTGTSATRTTVSLTEEAKNAGADACLLVTPYYSKPTEEGMYKHFKTVAQAVDIPQILYNIPSRASVDLRPDTIARLAEFDTIVGVKEASEGTVRISELLRICPEEFAIYSGNDLTGCEALLLGAAGIVSATSNVVPRLMHNMCQEAFKGNYEAARRINEKMLQLHQALSLESNPIPVKWALQRMSRIEPSIRLPLTSLSAQYHREVEMALENLGIL